MAKIKGLKATKNKISQKVNIKQEFGFDTERNPALKQVIGQAMIDRIAERTEAGKDVGGDDFSGSYSDEYADSIEFKVYGKKKGDINLTQSGTMLGTMDIIDESRDTLTLGWDDDVQNKKAANHHQGITVPKREFFGVTEDDINSLKQEFADDIERAKEEFRPQEQTTTAADIIATLEAAQFKTRVVDDPTVRALFDSATLSLLDRDLF